MLDDISTIDYAFRSLFHKLSGPFQDFVIGGSSAASDEYGDT
jgi:hypothetical protein